MTDTDRLAEAFYADRDPAFIQEDEDLAHQRELWESRTMTTAEHLIETALESLDEEEIEYLQSQTESLGEWLTEYLEDM